jgi:hypothetical protein
MQRADARIAAPGEDHLLRAAHADDLVVDQVGRHADEGEILSLLADHLMAGSIGDQVREPFHCDRIAVTQILLDRFGELQYGRHSFPPHSPIRGIRLTHSNIYEFRRSRLTLRPALDSCQARGHSIEPIRRVLAAILICGRKVAIHHHLIASRRIVRIAHKFIEVRHANSLSKVERVPGHAS